MGTTESIHRVAFVWEPQAGDGDGEIDVHVDGRPLRELVRVAELPSATADRQADLAGAYSGLRLWNFEAEPGRTPRRHYLGAPGSSLHDRAVKTALLGCGCGEAGCWPLRAHVVVEGSTVVWSDFEQPHRRAWSHADLGPLRFDWAQYERALAELESVLPPASTIG